MAMIARLAPESRYVPSIHLLPEDRQFFIAREAEKRRLRKANFTRSKTPDVPGAR